MRFFTVLLLFVATLGSAQGKYKLISTINTSGDLFTTDNQCNVYVVKGNELTKYDKTGKQLYRYSNKNYGNISFVDASNMLRILVYFREFTVVAFLDNTLTEHGQPLNLMTLDMTQVPVVCSSYDNGMWVFDQPRFALLRYDKNFSDIRETGNLQQMLTDSIQPVQMMEYNNRLYLNDPRIGVCIFDIYGTYYKTIPEKGLSSFQPIGDWVYFPSGKKIKAYHIKTTEEKEFEVPAEFKAFRLETDILVLQGSESIFLYVAD